MEQSQPSTPGTTWSRQGWSATPEEGFTMVHPTEQSEREDEAIGLPFNVHHELHVDSDELAVLPREWVETLKVR